MGSIELLEQLVPMGTQTNSKRRLPPAAPKMAVQGKGCWVKGDNGREYLDMVAGLGAVILGHNDEPVSVAAVTALAKGMSLPLPTAYEYDVAEQLVHMIPCAEMVRFGKNGADATAAAVRIARAATRRIPVLRCGYHGYQDWCVAKSDGVPTQDTWAVRYNDTRDLEGLLKQLKPACFILEPILVHPHPVTMPLPSYLNEVVVMCHFYGALCIFDETVTGFRTHLGGASALYGVTPDLACVGKALGNGFPLSAVVGKREYMELLGKGVFFSTTHGGETMSLAAAAATLTALEDRRVPEALAAFGSELRIAYADLAYLTGCTERTKLSGPACRMDFWWDTAADQAAFNNALAEAGVLSLGTFTLMEAHTKDAAAFDFLVEALDTAFHAVSK